MPGMFPVNAQIGEQRYDTVRLYYTDTITELWALVDKTPTLVASAGASKLTRSTGQTFTDGTKAKWVVATDSGEWLITPGGGCGCGHFLRHWDPAKAVRT